MAFSIKDGEQVRTRIGRVASSTVIPAGSLCKFNASIGVFELFTGLTNEPVAYTTSGSKDGETEMEIAEGDFTLVGTATTNFYNEVREAGRDITIVGGVQYLSISTYANAVIKIMPYKDAGTLGSPKNIEFRIRRDKKIGY